MANEEDKTEEPKVIVAEFKVSMHCNACERSVAKTIAKIKGVEKFKTDMNKHVVEVTGTMDPQKVLKKLKKKTGKRVEVIEKKEDGEGKKDETEAGNYGNEGWVDLQGQNADPSSRFDYCCVEEDVLMMFSDENPNACCTM